jgi:hypothetical protein
MADKPPKVVVDQHPHCRSEEGPLVQLGDSRTFCFLSIQILFGASATLSGRSPSPAGPNLERAASAPISTRDLDFVIGKFVTTKSAASD